MAVKKAGGTNNGFAPMRKGPASRTLMGNQDTVNKGDSLAGGAAVPTTFRCPAGLKEEARRFSEESGLTMTQLIVEGLEWRISKYR